MHKFSTAEDGYDGYTRLVPVRTRRKSLIPHTPTRGRGYPMPNSDPRLAYTANGLAAAQAASRCAHVKLDGSRCGAPALQGKPLCRFHVRAFASRRRLPFIEDAASIQLALMNVVRGIESGALNYKAASLMLYALQIATMNMKRLDALFAPLGHDAELEQRERTLSERLLDRLNDEAFCDQLSAARKYSTGETPVIPTAVEGPRA